MGNIANKWFDIDYLLNKELYKEVAKLTPKQLAENLAFRKYFLNLKVYNSSYKASFFWERDRLLDSKIKHYHYVLDNDYTKLDYIAKKADLNYVAGTNELNILVNTTSTLDDVAKAIKKMVKLHRAEYSITTNKKDVINSFVKNKYLQILDLMIFCKFENKKFRAIDVNEFIFYDDPKEVSNLTSKKYGIIPKALKKVSKEYISRLFF
ncbi:hypothetical protein LA02_472 [Francisella philomiragia]|uniref:DUF6387 family protein n=1 Tax=Francisella philomiragia TaxID=28110 RepID=UPI0005A5696E|nr:hypothetical protein [Francisella philomiragia]AJI57505.1 hypothetical protein LA02_472 [Francisella philomiragia]